NIAGSQMSERGRDVAMEQQRKRRNLVEYKAQLEAELEGWGMETDAALLRRRKERDNLKENVARDVTIDRCALYRDLGLEDPTTILHSVMKRVDDHSKMSAERHTEVLKDSTRTSSPFHECIILKL
ncbi:hypothetical protein PFISCL1PPCAC_22493, partial [Pristionchus fissidentatus]